MIKIPQQPPGPVELAGPTFEQQVAHLKELDSMFNERAKLMISFTTREPSVAWAEDISRSFQICKLWVDMETFRQRTVLNFGHGLSIVTVEILASDEEAWRAELATWSTYDTCERF